MGSGNVEDKDYENYLDELEARAEATCRADGEALKHEVWACKVGDLLEVIKDMTFNGSAEEQFNGTAVRTEMPAQGQIYRVVALKGRGWDMQRMSGEEPDEIRAMNWEIPEFYRVLPPAD